MAKNAKSTKVPWTVFMTSMGLRTRVDNMRYLLYISENNRT